MYAITYLEVHPYLTPIAHRLTLVLPRLLVVNAHHYRGIGSQRCARFDRESGGSLPRNPVAKRDRFARWGLQQNRRVADDGGVAGDQIDGADGPGSIQLDRKREFLRQLHSVGSDL